jgi:hypothetical protein
MPSFVKTRLKDGRELSATCFIFSSSDRGAMILTPSDRATRNFISKAHDDAKRLFGEHPIILIPPRITRDEKDQPWLPPVRLIAEFSSAPTDDAFCLSTAVVIWYQREAFPFIGDDVVGDFEVIDWEKDAKNVTLL